MVNFLQVFAPFHLNIYFRQYAFVLRLPPFRFPQPRETEIPSAQHAAGIVEKQSGSEIFN
jgi:hypothetical protein